MQHSVSKIELAQEWLTIADIQNNMFLISPAMLKKEIPHQISSKQLCDLENSISVA